MHHVDDIQMIALPPLIQHILPRHSTLLVRTICEAGTRLHGKLMQYKEKFIEMIIHYQIHCKSIWNNDHDNNKSKVVTCIFTSVSDFSFIQHDDGLVLNVVVVVLPASIIYADHQISACTRQRQNFESSSLMYFCDCQS